MVFSIPNFFRFHMFHPEKLPEQHRTTALVMSIVLGIFTAGFCHLFVFTFFYNRNFKPIDSPTDHIQKIETTFKSKMNKEIHESFLPLVKLATAKPIIKPEELTKLWDNKKFLNQFHNNKSLRQLIYEWNKKQVETWHTLDKNSQMTLLNTRRQALSVEELDVLECERVHCREQLSFLGTDEEVDYNIYNSDMNIMKDLVNDQSKLEDFTKDEGSYASVLHLMLGLVAPDSLDIKELLNIHFSQVLKNNSIEWPPTAEEFCQNVDPSLILSDSEYSVIKDFFTERMKTFNTLLQIKERSSDFDFSRRVLRLCLKDLCKGPTLCLKLMNHEEIDQIIDKIPAKEMLQLTQSQLQMLDVNKLTPSRRRILRNHYRTRG